MNRLAFLGCLLLTSCFINYLGKGYESYQKGDLESAERFFQTAVKKKPRDPIAHNNLGVVLMELDRGEEASQHFKMATVLAKSPYAAPHINLAKLYFEKGSLDLARTSADKALAIDGGSPVVQLVTANIYCAKNINISEARGLVKSALTSASLSDPDKPAAWSTLAETEYKLKNIDAALAAIDTAIALDTENSFYRQQRSLYKP